jgi:hypothetical protein
MLRKTNCTAACLRFLVLATLVASVTASCSSSGNNSQGGASSVALDPTQPHYGNSDSEWGALWWKWVYQLPQSLNDAGMPACFIPFQDPTGANCGDGQSGDVFFLAGTSGGTVVRDKCVVPSGKAILFPIFNFASDNGGVPTAMQMSDTGLQSLVKSAMAGVQVSSLSAEFDGTSIPNLASYATQITQFSYTLPPEPNIYTCQGEPGVTGVVDPSYAAGYYVMLAPPSTGAHTLHFAGTSNASNPPVMVDVTYHLTIQ